MCCFTEVVEHVSDTSIYARAVGPRQILVYEMLYAAKSELAMVLPLPVPPGLAEDALAFISLDDCPDFFAHLRDGFPRAHRKLTLSGGTEAASIDLGAKLAVVDVGGFEASFVPRAEDFGRLDERFRLPADLWLQLNTYADWGFAVFKLKPGEKRVHPMAFSFPRRDRQRLFFPTLHIHHRSVEPSAEFDHALYCQVEPAMNWHLHGWEESRAAASRFVRCEQAKALFELDRPCWRRELKGRRENADAWLGRGGRIPAVLGYTDA
jgi:hypothetical protein